MTPEELVLDGLKKNIQDEVARVKAEMAKGLLEKAEFNTRLAEINAKFDELKTKTIQPESIQGIQEQIDKLNEKHEALKLTGHKAESFIESIVGKAAELRAQYKEKGKGVLELTLKQPVNMGITTTTGTGVVPPDREPGISYAPKRRPVMLETILSGTTTSNVVEWIEKVTEEGAPAFRREFETYPKRSWGSVTRSLTVKKITVLAEFSKEIVDDVDLFQAELRRDLVEQLQLVLDNEILRGTQGDPGEAGLKGLSEYAQAWNNGTLRVPNPTIYDVIAVAINQIEEEHHFPTVILMRPSTALAMKLAKDGQGNYVMPPFASANGTSIEGVAVVTNTLLGANELLIMDGTKAQYLTKQNWQIEMSNSHASNFAQGMLAVTLTGRGVLKVKNTDTRAFVHVANVNTAITALRPTP